MERLRAHMNNTAFHHTVFSLPFALMGALLAAGGNPPLGELGWIVLAITAARSAALALDNLADLKYDKQQPRLAYRAMVQGRVTKKEALVFIGVCLLVLVFAVLQLNPVCIRLLPFAALPFLVYPFLKRVTGWVHLFLGIAIGMAPAGGFRLSFDFDDSVVVDREAQFSQDLRLVQAGLMSKVEFRMRNMREDEATARKMIASVQAETPTDLFQGG